MRIEVLKNDRELGEKAAQYIAQQLNSAINSNGFARLVLSTGNSQLTTINELIKTDVDWSKVEMFHLDEYVDLPITHKASFRKYLKERFISKVNLKEVYLVDGEQPIQEHIDYLASVVNQSKIDVAVVGIGENAHIAFNDPPADFETKEAFIKVQLDDTCKNQQVNEGWFPSVEDVPKEAITMTVHQIMQSDKIISCVPYGVKAKAVKETLDSKINNMIPATILKEHTDWTLFLDKESASLLDL